MKKKRILSWLMTVAMVLSLVPAAAMAAEEENNDSQEEATYVLMNIPYADFYQAELGESNTVPVDAVSSATLNKTRTGSLVGGSYHVKSDGSDITGITFPVKVTESAQEWLKKQTKVEADTTVTIQVTNRGQTTTTTYSGKDALFEKDSYSYYVLSEDEQPAYYKELTIDNENNLSFGAIQSGSTTTLNDVSAKITTDTTFGDYEIDLTSATLQKVSSIYGVVLHAKDSNDKETSYGLRHLENIWQKTKLAFCTGFTTEVHNSSTSSAHYESIMGQTINKITYYTDQGIYKIDDLSLYVPIKVENSFAVTDADVSEGTTTVTSTGLTDYNTFTCNNEAITYNNDTLTWTSDDNIQPGTYTLTATDSEGKYAPVSTTFTLSTTDTVAKYDEDTKALTKADSAAAFANYLKNITSVSVNGKAYAASGRGAVEIIREDGSLNWDAASGNNYILGTGNHSIVVTATGYQDLSFSITRTADGSAAAPYEIASVEDLTSIQNNLSAHYKLTDNINLENTTWTPIGTFSLAEGSETGEDPDPTYAFTGTFDGNGKTISNLTVSGDMSVGLFGCVGEGGTVKNLTIQNATVSGNCMAAAVAGYAYKAAVENVTLTATENGENTITANAMGADETAIAPNMVAGIVGAGMDSTLTNCTVENTTLTANGLDAATALGDNVHDIGLVGGGLEGCTLSGCSASDSTVTVTGPYAFGIGGLSGCAMSSDKVESCSVTGVEIKAEGDNAYLVGGLVGYTGLTDGDTTALNNCDVSDTPIIVGTDAARVGGLVGGGFYLEIYKDYFPVPTAFTVDEESSVAGTAITAGTGSTAIGTVAGHTYQSEVKATTGTGQEINTVTIGETQVTNPQAVGAVQPVSSGSHSSGGSSTAATYPVTTPTSAANGKVSVSPQNAKAGAVVTITATPNSGYELKSLTVTDQNGKAIALTDNGDGTYSFTMPDGKVNVSTDFQAQQQPTPSTGFADVAAGTYYADAVQWAVEQGITNGTAPNTFSPEEACTRGQVVTFLWRAMGSPTPAGTGSAFTDVPAGTYYADAVQWAVEQGITNGTAPDAFSPEETVTRGQVVTFLWRLASQPAASGPSFSDVAADAYYAGAVRWAMQEEITNGTAPNTFSPKEACTRGQIVTFLYRDLAQ